MCEPLIKGFYDVQSLKIIFVIVLGLLFLFNENNVVSAKSHLNLFIKTAFHS